MKQNFNKPKKQTKKKNTNKTKHTTDNTKHTTDNTNLENNNENYSLLYSLIICQNQSSTTTTTTKDNSNLFLNKIWRNNYIKNQIIQYLKKYVYYSKTVKVNRITDFQNLKNKEYRSSIAIDYLAESLVIPMTVTELTIESNIDMDRFFRANKNQIPESITSLIFNGYDKSFKVGGFILSNVTKLDLGFWRQSVPSNFIPSSVTTLYCVFENFLPNQIPCSVTKLKGAFYGKDKTLIAGVIPNSVKHLTLESFYGDIEPNSIPESVEELEFSCFNKPLQIGTLPNMLKKLNLGYHFNQPITIGVLPNSITTLNLGDFNHPIISNSLPSNLINLTTGSNFIQKVLPGNVPLSIKTWRFGSLYPFRLLNHPFEKSVVSNNCDLINY